MTKQLIEEGRRTRLHSFNDYRRFFGLKPYESFHELTGNEEIATVLQELYGDVDAVEFIVGEFDSIDLLINKKRVNLIKCDRKRF